MRKKIMKTCNQMLFIAALVLLLGSASQAAVIFETTDYISGREGKKYEFHSPQGHNNSIVTLTDLSWGPLDFDFIGLSVSTSTQTLGHLTNPGSFSFNILPDTTYFCNVFGIGGGEFDTGLYGVQVTAAPVPAALGLFASGLIALVAIKRRSA